ncbi:hypothetical protein [Synechococcus sp. R5-12]|uniref:hypothetical protein n=1 Tax=Synechococcus sp. R5-12 TaxID=2421321 RepID=UPI0039C63E9D
MSSLRSRRFFLQLLMFGGGAAALAACGGTSSSSIPPLGEPGFPQGVFAGDPTAEGAVLSTRVIPASATDTVAVTLQVAEFAAMRSRPDRCGSFAGFPVRIEGSLLYSGSLFL